MSNQVLSKSNTYKTTRRRCYARNVGVITATLAILLGTAFFISSPFRAPEASADVLPLDCTTNGLDIDITPSATLVQHGDIITYVVCFDNDNPGDCTVTAVESTLVLPDDTVITILSDATIAGPDDPVPGDAFCCPSADLRCATAGPYAYVVSHDDETGPVAGCPPEKNGGNTVKIVAAYAEFSGTVHISPVDLDGSAEGCKTAPAVVQHGACCFPDEETCAEDYGQAECEEAGGTFKGVDSVCLDPQACCLPDDTCKFIDPECCVLEGGTPKGESSECGGLEACCFDDGTCSIMDSTCCENAGGTAKGPGSECGGLEACCFDDGTCSIMDSTCCENAGGTAKGPGSECGGLEACCFDDGTCSIMDSTCCENAGGTAKGPGSKCGGIQACCFDDGTCSVMDATCCENAGGTAKGRGSECGGMEACCFDDGTCSVMDATCCENAGGTAKGPGSECGGIQACCFDDGTCSAMDASCCENAGGTAKGPDSKCGGIQACCFDDGTCSEMDALCCTNAGGTPEGDGSDCESSSCGLGCRMTGGGHARHQGNRYTWGGQIGAPTADQPQPCGEWTHRQHTGPGGKWTFHAGTASAPPGTEIDLVICCDAGWCDPARPAPAKQIKFEGIGTFKNIHIPPDPKLPEEDQPVAGETFHWFEARVEDLGEPGSHGSDDPDICPLEGFNCSTGDCACADFYTIRIFQGYDPDKEKPNKKDMIYEIYGYLDGGNHQIHPPIPGDHNCHGGGN